jgi:hypothetical protein
MTTEISHRCPSCGAAVREADALFCHECGRPVSLKIKNSEAAEVGEVSANAKVDKPATEAADAAPIESPQAEPASEGDSPATVTNSGPVPVAKGETASKANESETAQPAARRGDKTRERLHRAGEVARGVTRGVIEEPAKRVEKIRHVSTVVIEEASYDPSLRFVLVALGLFMVFIVLLVLSKVMG